MDKSLKANRQEIDPTVDVPMVFIVGCPRSGTTWIERMFQDHPRVVYTYEAAIFSCLLEAWWLHIESPVGVEIPPPVGPGLKDRGLDLLEKLLVRRRRPWDAAWRGVLLAYFEDQLAFILNHSRLRRSVTEFSELRHRLVSYDVLCQLIDEAEQASYKSHEEKLVHVARGIYQRFFASRKGNAEQVLVDKTPGNLFHADFILDHFPSARIIEAVRDGRDVCVSMDAYKAYMPQDRLVQVVTWKSFAQKGLELRKNPAYAGRILTTRYEELRRDTAGQVERMFEFAGLEATPEESRRIADSRHISKVSGAGEGQHVRKGIVGGWRRHFSPEDIDIFRSQAGDILQQSGYSW